MAQLNCTGCRTPLLYPRGAVQVQCSLCGAMNDAGRSNQLGHVACSGCGTVLMYQLGARSIKCAVCNHITPASPHTGEAFPSRSSHNMSLQYSRPDAPAIQVVPSNRSQMSSFERHQRAGNEQRPEGESVGGQVRTESNDRGDGGTTSQTVVLIQNPAADSAEGRDFAIGISK